MATPARLPSSLLASPDWFAAEAPSRRTAAALALSLGLGCVWTGQRALAGADPGVTAWTAWFAGLGLVVWLCECAGRVEQAAYFGRVEQAGRVGQTAPSARAGLAAASDGAPAAPSGTSRMSRTATVILVGVGLVSAYLWRVAPGRAITDSSLDLVLLWLASIVGLVIAATGPPRREHAARLRTWAWRVRGDALIIAAIVGVALVPRVYDLSSFPWAMSGDEGTFAITARSALHGELSNPFRTSAWWGYPSLLFIVQGWLMGVTGETIGGARVLSALLGTASVVAIYGLTRHHAGRATALVAAMLAATFHFHLFWSRDAQNAVASMFFIPLALLLLDRGLVGRRRVDSLAAGLVIGLAQFFHPSNRILVPIAIAYAAYAVLYQRPRRAAQLVHAARVVVPDALWAAAGVVVGHLPLLAYFWHHPDQYSDRADQVSVFASGWLDAERQRTGKRAIEILWMQFRNAALLPFRTDARGHFHPAMLFASWPLVIPLAIGMTIVTVTLWRRRSFGLALAFWATVAGIALTEGPPQTNRYTSSGPFLAIFAAIGIVAVARILTRLVRVPPLPVAMLVAATTVLIAGWHLNWYFAEPNPVAVSSDTNTQIANLLAHQAAAHGAGLTVYFAGVPRMSYRGFNNIPYIAPDADGIDVVEPWTAVGPVPSVTGPTLFAFVPERIDELDLVRAWFPDGTTNVSFLPDGEQVLTTYFVGAPPARAVQAGVRQVAGASRLSAAFHERRLPVRSTERS